MRWTEWALTTNDYFLRTPPEIHGRHPVDASDRAIGGARLRGVKLSTDIVDRVRLEGNAGRASLLRAVVDQTVLTNVQIARAGAAAPVVRLAVCQIVLEAADSRVEVLEYLPWSVDSGRNCVVHLAFGAAQRFQP